MKERHGDGALSTAGAEYSEEAISAPPRLPFLDQSSLSSDSLSISRDCTFFVLRDMVTTRSFCYPESEVKRDDHVGRQRLVFFAQAS